MAEPEAAQTIMSRWCEPCRTWHHGMLVGVIEWQDPPWCKEKNPDGWDDSRLAAVRRALEIRPTAYRASSAVDGVPTLPADAGGAPPSDSKRKGAGNGPTTGLAF